MKKILLLSLLVACKKPAPVAPVTGISLSITFTTTVTQFSLEALQGSTVVGPAKSEPATAGAALKSPYTTDLLFDDSLAGSSVTIAATALSAGAMVAVGQANVALVKDVLTPLVVTLSSPACGDGIITPPEQCDDGNTVSGDGCSSTCQTEIAPPAAVCGNSVVESGETCDIGAATSPGCVACTLTSGWSCTSSVCSDSNCGNGTIDPGEQCDDGNTTTGDGCDDSCQIEISTPQWTCTGTPSCCTRCGDGVINNPTQCVSTGEQCDGSAYPIGYSCLTLGKLNENPASAPSGKNNIGCSSACKFDSSNCNQDIGTVTNIKAAIAEAEDLPGHDIISIQPSGTKTYSVSDSASDKSALIINENGSPPDGMTFQGLNGVGTVTFTTNVSNDVNEVFDVKSGGNDFIGLVFQVAPPTQYAMNLESGVDAGNNLIKFCSFVRAPAIVGTWQSSQEFIEVDSSDNSVLYSAFNNSGGGASSALTSAINIGAGNDNNIMLNAMTATATANQTYGVSVATATTAIDNDVEANFIGLSNNGTATTTGIYIHGADGTKVAMNVVEGGTFNGIDIDTSDATLVDNNSIYNDTGSGTPLIWNNATKSCYRNNAVYSATPMSISNTMTLGGASDCSGIVSSNNDFVRAGGTTRCGDDGSGICATACGLIATPGPLCALDVNPGFTTSSPDLCLPASGSGSALINAGAIITCGSTTPCYDMVDDTPNVLYYEGGAPDIGARESGTSRTYGVDSVVSACP